MTDIVLYVAATEPEAVSGAAALERATATLVVVPASSIETIRERAPAADCVVFSGTPTTTAGAHLLDVIDACERTPLVLYTDAAYGPTTARGTDGIDGYVRRDGDRATPHLADEIRWVCHEPPAARAAGTESDPIPIGPVTQAENADSNGENADSNARAGPDRDRLATLLEAVPDPAIRFAIDDADDPVVRDANTAFERVFGDDPDSLRGTRLAAHSVLDAIAEAVAASDDRDTDGAPLHVVDHCRTDDGWRTILGTAVLDREQNTGFATVRDVTDRKRRDRVLDARHEQLAAFEEIVDRELRNQLNLAQGYLEAARETNDLDHFAEVAAAHDRLLESIDTLSELSRRRDVIATVEPVALQDVARRAWARLDDPEDRTLRVEGDRLLEADKERVTDVFEHLFRSAATGVDDSREGTDSEHVTIRVDACPSGFVVTDDGPTIPDDERASLLESGAKAADRRGYGFEVVRRIAEAHGWSVSIDARDGGGTRIEFTGAAVDEKDVFSDSTHCLERSLTDLERTCSDLEFTTATLERPLSELDCEAFEPDLGGNNGEND